jgi:hypothetical protein
MKLPRLDKSLATSLPKPQFAPVTTATFPYNVSSLLYSLPVVTLDLEIDQNSLNIPKIKNKPQQSH